MLLWVLYRGPNPLILITEQVTIYLWSVTDTRLVFVLGNCSLLFLPAGGDKAQVCNGRCSTAARQSHYFKFWCIFPVFFSFYFSGWIAFTATRDEKIKWISLRFCFCFGYSRKPDVVLQRCRGGTKCLFPLLGVKLLTETGLKSFFLVV